MQAPAEAAVNFIPELTHEQHRMRASESLIVDLARSAGAERFRNLVAPIRLIFAPKIPNALSRDCLN
jgi:hypothetical protein